MLGQFEGPARGKGITGEHRERKRVNSGSKEFQRKKILPIQRGQPGSALKKQHDDVGTYIDNRRQGRSSLEIVMGSVERQGVEMEDLRVKVGESIHGIKGDRGNSKTASRVAGRIRVHGEMACGWGIFWGETKPRVPQKKKNGLGKLRDKPTRDHQFLLP